MKTLFNADIYDWPSWEKAAQSAEAFKPIIEFILISNALPVEALPVEALPVENANNIEVCPPAINAVFKAGQYIIKIFSPSESGMDTEIDFKTEKFGMERAASLGISVPILYASGCIHDRYDFKYFVMEYINGGTFGELEINFSDSEKYNYARQLRDITDKLNTPCDNFNGKNILLRAKNCEYWNDMPQEFQIQRLEYLNRININPSVYVHGDLHVKNILISGNKLFIIDFADAVLAPPEYELASLTGLFLFKKPYMDGYFGCCDADILTGRFLDGILIHEYGYFIINNNFGCTEGITNLDILWNRIN